MTLMPLIRPLAADDIPALSGVLARAYASDQDFASRLRSYLHLSAVATFVAQRNGEPVGMVVGNDYGPVAYVSQMAVDPVLARQGIGTQLMDGLEAWARARKFTAIELDATAAGLPLYSRYGFVPTDQTDVYEWRGGNRRSSTGVRRYTSTDRAKILALDARAFGGDRVEVLGQLLDTLAASTVVVDDAVVDNIAGYAVAQPRAGRLGPLIAPDAGVASALIAAAGNHLRLGHVISVPASNAAAVAVLSQHGYHYVRSLTHMVSGTPPLGGRRPQLFARINLGQG